MNPSLLLLADLFFPFGGFAFIGFFPADALFPLLAFFVPVYLVLTRRGWLVWSYLLALLISTGWVFLVGDGYGYNQNFASISGLALFPLLGWALGTWALYMLFYTHKGERLRRSSFAVNLFVFSLLYSVILIVFETIGYHVFSIHNSVTSTYPGLPICDCLHLPLWMQVGYFLKAPLYFVLCALLRIDGPRP